jgi:hypothetical protein
MQLFLTWRYYIVYVQALCCLPFRQLNSLSHCRSKNVIVTTLILGIIATQISACLTATASVVSYTSLHDRWRVITSAIIWLGKWVDVTPSSHIYLTMMTTVSSASADILVAIALLLELRTMKTSYSRTKG